MPDVPMLEALVALVATEELVAAAVVVPVV